jgi:hypothetical protein
MGPQARLACDVERGARARDITHLERGAEDPVFSSDTTAL